MAKQPTEIELSITSLSDAGLGGGEHNDRPVWVRNALPGEVAKAKILKRREVSDLPTVSQWTS